MQADKSQNKGCTNLICPGFVQTDTSFHLGQPMENTSTYNGKQFEMSVDITHDPETKNWWVGIQNKKLGYYPEILFSNLAFANLGGWTGMTSTNVGNTSPPMGSGHLPDNNLLRSCYIRQMHFLDSSRRFNGTDFDEIEIYEDIPRCYRVSYAGWNDEIQGYSMLFGGSGGNCGD
ncbi:putative neprosin [Lupinus albus]|uniref:Putative neprosin n=1 Tax=Lupinus albus TaxID=3870 RepID=A0A6A4QVA5_LUPAL|nr:putative neprosin [Lupinus albus]